MGADGGADLKLSHQADSGLFTYPATAHGISSNPEDSGLRQ